MEDLARTALADRANPLSLAQQASPIQIDLRQDSVVRNAPKSAQWRWLLMQRGTVNLAGETTIRAYAENPSSAAPRKPAEIRHSNSAKFPMP